MAHIDDLLERFKNVAEGKYVGKPHVDFSSYAVTNFLCFIV